MRSIFKKIISKLLEIEARLVLRKYKPRIIGITGSVGKTSTKDAVFAAIGRIDQFQVEFVVIPFVLQRTGGNFRV